mgnify:CR=1 FL=1
MQTLGYAATNDNFNILIVRKGKVTHQLAKAEVGEKKFNAVLEALKNQQSYESLELIIAA